MKKLFVLTTVLASLFFTSCATTLWVTRQRPAELELNGAESISVLPVAVSNGGDSTSSGSSGVDMVLSFFEWLATDPNEERCAREITSSLISKLTNSGFFKVVPSSSVESAIRSNAKIPCDAYLSGKIARYYVSTDKSYYEEMINGQRVRLAQYRDRVTLDLTYQIIDAKTNQIIAYKVRTIENYSSYYKSKSSQPYPYDVIRWQIDDATDGILRELQPYNESVGITFMKDKTKNVLMKNADELAKAGLLDESRETFLNVYKETGMLAAGYNAAQIMQAQADYDEAEKLMSELVTRFADKKAMEALRSIQNEKRQRDRLKNQLNARSSNTDNSVINAK